MTAQYDPHEDWGWQDLEDSDNKSNSLTERLERALSGFNRPLTNMTDRANARTTED